MNLKCRQVITLCGIIGISISMPGFPAMAVARESGSAVALSATAFPPVIVAQTEGLGDPTAVDPVEELPARPAGHEEVSVEQGE